VSAAPQFLPPDPSRIQEVETRGVNEGELDPAIKAILRKNRDAVREAERRARDAERLATLTHCPNCGEDLR
jgi:hypothetical protein